MLSDPRFSADRFTYHPRFKQLPEEVQERLRDDKARAGSFINMDPPEHTRYRKLLTGQFTVRRMRMLGARIEEIVTERLDAMLAKGNTADLMADFALPVPSLVICELLGVRYEDRAEFQERTRGLLRMNMPVEEALENAEAMRAFMQRLVTDKRENPADDMISGLIHHAGADPALTDDELINIANLLLMAGFETTASMLGLGIFVLLQRPDQLAALRDDPSRVGRRRRGAAALPVHRPHRILPVRQGGPGARRRAAPGRLDRGGLPDGRQPGRAALDGPGHAGRHAGSGARTWRSATACTSASASSSPGWR